MSNDFRQLKVVITAAECGSFSSAALQLNTEASAISRAVRDVEEQLGVPIFERLSRGVRLTAAGVSYVASAREILERYERAGVAAKLAGSGRALHLSVGFVWSAASRPIVELLRALAAEAPTIAVEVVEIGNGELIDRLRSGRLDVSVAATDPPPLPRLVDIESFSSMPLWLEPLVVAVPAKDALWSVTWADLADARLLCRTIDDWPRFVRHVERLGGPRLAFEPHAVSQEGVLGLVAAGLGWTVVPASLDHLLPSGVSAVPIASPGASLLVEAVWNPENENVALTRFLELCRRLHDLPGAAPSQTLDPSP